MESKKSSREAVVDVYVRPNSKQFSVKIEGDDIIVFCKEAPVRGRVNRELAKKLSRILKRRVEIVAGLTSRNKKLLIEDISLEEVRAILSSPQKS